MNKEDMIMLIKAYDAWEALNEKIGDLTGGSMIDNPEFYPLDDIYVVIKRNSRYPNDDDKDTYALRTVLDDTEMSPEQRYELIKPE